MYVSNLGFQVTNEELKSLFAKFGEVTSAKVVMDRETGRSRGFGFVEMPDEAASKQAMQELQGREIEGRALSVSVAKAKEERSGGSYSQNKSYSKW